MLLLLLLLLLRGGCCSRGGHMVWDVEGDDVDLSGVVIGFAHQGFRRRGGHVAGARVAGSWEASATLGHGRKLQAGLAVCYSPSGVKGKAGGGGPGDVWGEGTQAVLCRRVR